MASFRGAVNLCYASRVLEASVYNDGFVRENKPAALPGLDHSIHAVYQKPANKRRIVYLSSLLQVIPGDLNRVFLQMG
jgi:hypothetical protein